MSKDLDKALGLSTMPSNLSQWGDKLPAVIQEPVSDSEQVVEDTTKARGGLYDAFEVSKTAVQDMIKIAQSSQHPKAYEALNSAIKTLSEISMNLAELQIKKQRLNGGNKGSDVESQTINNLFVGSTAELQKMIEEMKSKTPNV